MANCPNRNWIIDELVRDIAAAFLSLRVDCCETSRLSGRKAMEAWYLPLFTRVRWRRQPLQCFLSIVAFTVKIAIFIVVSVFVGRAAMMFLIGVHHIIRDDAAGLGILQMPFNLKMVETCLAIISIGIVTSVYSILIPRGSLMSTTSLYPSKPIEDNLGNLLSLAWPDVSSDLPCPTKPHEISKTKQASNATIQESSPKAIKLFYLGRMSTDDHSRHVAKGVVQCAAKPSGDIQQSKVWLTTGSLLTKDVVQLLIWEWTSLWLMALMFVATLMFNGFMTNEPNHDSYPRLVIILMYTVSYLFHFYYVWNICLRFFTNVATGAAWSLLERAKFAVGHTEKLQRHYPGTPFDFNCIDKASTEFVPKTYQALFKHDVYEAGQDIDVDPTSIRVEEDNLAEIRQAIGTLSKAQVDERVAATRNVNKALDRVISNAMVIMGVTLSTGFSAWTSNQFTENSPNNFNSTQIGSLALLASLSLGTATMFTSAMYLSIMESSFYSILSLKEIKINGHAVDHTKKRRSALEPLSFTRNTVPARRVGFWDIMRTNRRGSFLSVLFLGPACALLPNRKDHERTSTGTDFDLKAKVRDSVVVFTTKQTDTHKRRRDGENVEAINVCYIPDAVDLGDKDTTAMAREEKLSTAV